MTRTGKRAFRPVFDDLEGRQLLTLVGTTVAETSFSAPAIPPQGAVHEKASRRSHFNP